MVKSTTKTCFPRQSGVIFQYCRRNTPISTLHAPTSSFQVSSRSFYEELMKIRSGSVSNEERSRLVSKFLPNDFSPTELFKNSVFRVVTQNYFWKTHPFFSKFQFSSYEAIFGKLIPANFMRIYSVFYNIMS